MLVLSYVGLYHGFFQTVADTPLFRKALTFEGDGTRARMLMAERHSSCIFDLMSQTRGFARLSATRTAI